MKGVVEQIFVASDGSAPMRPVESADAVRGGLRGDRYLTGDGYYSGVDECEVTFIEAEAVEWIRDEFGIDLADGRHRRNVVVRGVELYDFLGSSFRVGDAAFYGVRPRPPCAHLEELAGEEEVARSLKRGRGGICANVVATGVIGLGDVIEPVERVEHPATDD